jgi:peptidyl-tRNA hydrolase, PTH1 family
MLVEKLADRLKVLWSNEKRFKARLAKYRENSRKVFLAQPLTYMNLSGEAVRMVSDFYRIEPRSILAVVDDADLPLGQVRMRPDGSSGGHHGLESLEQMLGTRQFPRLRLGIGRRGDGRRDISGYVLQPFAEEDEVVLTKVLERAVQQAKCWCEHGTTRAMNEFNGSVEPTGQN